MYKATVFSVTDFIGGIIDEKQSKGDIKSVQYWRGGGICCLN